MLIASASGWFIVVKNNKNFVDSCEQKRHIKALIMCFYVKYEENSSIFRYSGIKSCKNKKVFLMNVFSFRLESPTRTLTMEAPRGVEVSSAKGPLKISSRKDLQLDSTEGEVRRIQVALRWRRPTLVCLCFHRV